jgi:hypothetical protein
MMNLVFLVLALLLTAPQIATAASPMGRISGGTATSTCIGSVSSPTCTAETLLACFARADVALCRRVNVADAGSELQAGSHTIEYIIDRQTTIKQQDITDDLKDLEYYKPGYVLLEIRRRDCAAGQATCADAAWSDLQIFVRPLATGGWDIAAWRGDNEQESAPEIPETYEPAKKPGQ